MSTDYFANAVYGVRLPPKAVRRLEKYIERVRPALRESEGADPDDEEDDDGRAGDRADRELEFLRKESPAYYAEVLRLAGAPKDAILFHTDGEDDRPGRCETEAGVWLAGYGLLYFPGKVPAWFRKSDGVTWHTWVTAG